MTDLSIQLVQRRTNRETYFPAGHRTEHLWSGWRAFRPRFCRAESASARAAGVLAVTALALLLISGCDVAPRKPEDVYTVYREHMKSGKLQDARELLTQKSQDLVAEISEKFKVEEAPERLSIFNALDPAGPPLIMKQGDNYTLLQVRTLRGGVRLVRLVRKNSDSPWKIDLSEELIALRRFLRIKGALDMFREQAGEYAESWKAFNDQLEKMAVPQESPPAVEKEPPARKGTKRRRGRRSGRGK